MSIDWNKRTPKPRTLCTKCGRTETDGDHTINQPFTQEGSFPRPATHDFELMTPKERFEKELAAARELAVAKTYLGFDLKLDAKGDIEMVTDPLVKILLDVAEEAGYTAEDIRRHLKLKET